MSTPFGVFPLLQEIPQEAIDISMGFFTMITVIALGIPMIRALGKRWERRELPPPQTPPDVTARLERIEHAVEAVAIEVERIAEAQRFTAKLMAEQPKRGLPGTDSPR
jgi:hypothetical protein